jgi:hypothetical protein
LKTSSQNEINSYQTEHLLLNINIQVITLCVLSWTNNDIDFLFNHPYLGWPCNYNFPSYFLNRPNSTYFWDWSLHTHTIIVSVNYMKKKGQVHYPTVTPSLLLGNWCHVQPNNHRDWNLHISKHSKVAKEKYNLEKFSMHNKWKLWGEDDGVDGLSMDYPEKMNVRKSKEATDLCHIS